MCYMCRQLKVRNYEYVLTWIWVFSDFSSIPVGIVLFFIAASITIIGISVITQCGICCTYGGSTRKFIDRPFPKQLRQLKTTNVWLQVEVGLDKIQCRKVNIREFEKVNLFNFHLLGLHTTRCLNRVRVDRKKMNVRKFFRPHLMLGNPEGFVKRTGVPYEDKPFKLYIISKSITEQKWQRKWNNGNIPDFYSDFHSKSNSLSHLLQRLVSVSVPLYFALCK